MQGTLPALLEGRAAEGRPVRVGLVGAGRFGTTVAAQVGQMRGLALLAVADVSEANARAALAAGYRGALEEVTLDRGGTGRAADAIAGGRAVLLDDGTRLAELPLDVVVEATGRPEVSARVVWAALGAGKHVVNVTVESDVLLGALFRRRADGAGVVYSVADGDQPGCTMRLVEWARALGYHVVAAGRGTRRHPSDHHGVPEEAFARFGYTEDLVARRRLNAHGLRTQRRPRPLAAGTGAPRPPGARPPPSTAGPPPAAGPGRPARPRRGR